MNKNVQHLNINSSMEFDIGKHLNSINDLLCYRNLIKHEDVLLISLVSQIDLFLLRCFVYKHGVSSVLELGSGETSRVLTNEGIKVDSFALEQMHSSNDWHNENLHTFHKQDILHSADEIVKFSNSIDMILIDALHTYNFADFYCNNILARCKKVPIFIHDCYVSPRKICGEQLRVEEFLLSNCGYDVELMSNVLEDATDSLLDDMSNIMKFDVKDRIRNRPEHTLPPCSMFLLPKS